MTSRNYRQLFTSLALIPALSGVGQAAYFEMETEIGPQEATEAPAELESCKSESVFDADANISPDGQQVRVFVATSSTVKGTNCTDQSVSVNATVIASGTIESNTGEIGPVTICLSASVSQKVSSAGAGYDAASAANAVSEVSSIGPIYDYPGMSISSQGADTDVQRFEVEAMIGDGIAAAVAAATAAAGGPGEGAASASSRAQLILTIGPCSAEMAPTMSSTALSALALVLGLLGAVAAGKRRSI
jgi:hypothetical protein